MKINFIFFLITGILGSFYCNSDNNGNTNANGDQILEETPHIVVNLESTIYGYKVTEKHRSNYFEFTFNNIGKPDLVFSRIDLVGPDTNAFIMGDIVPSSRKIKSNKSLAVPVTFKSPGRGVWLATLIIESNATNFPVLEIELVGPGAEDEIPDDPDIEVFEDVVEIKETSLINVPAAIIRMINLGSVFAPGESRYLEIFKFDLSEVGNDNPCPYFEFVQGPPLPGEVCIEENGICGLPGDPYYGCCGLACKEGICAPLEYANSVFGWTAVNFIDPPPDAGSYSCEFKIHSSDPDPEDNPKIVRINGTL